MSGRAVLGKGLDAKGLGERGEPPPVRRYYKGRLRAMA